MANVGKTSQSREETSIPVDCGYAWVVIFATSAIFCIVAGTYKCIGILKIELMLAHPDISQDIVLWVLSGSSCVTLICGPLVSHFLSKTSHRLLGMIGGGLACTGLMITGLSPNIFMLFGSYTLIFSLGVGCLNIVCFTSFLPYFKKHRALAVGIMAGGSGVGTIICPIIIRYLFDNYSHSGALMCYSGFYMQTIVLSALIRPASHYDQHDSRRKSVAHTHSTSASLSSTNDHMLDQVALIHPKGLLGYDRQRSLSLSTSSVNVLEVTTSPTLYSSVPERLSDHSDADFVLPTALPRGLYQSNALTSTMSMAMPTGSTFDVSGSEDTTSSEISTVEESPRSKYPWKIWCDHRTWVIGSTMFLATAGLNLLLLSAPSVGLQSGVSEDTITYVIMCSGVAEVAFRLLHGIFADRKIIPAQLQVALILFVMGFASLVSTFIHGIAGVSIVYGALASFGNAVYSLMPILIIELLGAANLSQVVGINGVYQTFSFILGTVITNVLYSHTQSWTEIYYFVGACFLCGSLLSTLYHIYNSFLKTSAKSSDSLPV